MSSPPASTACTARRADICLQFPKALKPVHVVGVRACARHALQPQQLRQSFDLDHADNGPALVASQFHVVAFHGRHDAAAALDARRFVRGDWHRPVSSLAAVAVHDSGIAWGSGRAQHDATR